MNPINIKTPRLLLQEFQHSDAPAVLEFASHPEVLAHSPWSLCDLQASKNWVSEMIYFSVITPRTIYELAIVNANTEKLIGTCLLGIKDILNREGYIGYTFRKDIWGKGYATEVSKTLLQFGFYNLGLHRITASSSPLNISSHRVLEKVGMQKEGLLRKNKLQHGKWRDSVIFSILEEEFRLTS